MSSEDRGTGLEGGMGGKKEAVREKQNTIHVKNGKAEVRENIRGVNKGLGEAEKAGEATYRCAAWVSSATVMPVSHRIMWR